MEQLSQYEATILAAGVTCVYNADDWRWLVQSGLEAANDASADEGAAQQH